MDIFGYVTCSILNLKKCDQLKGLSRFCDGSYISRINDSFQNNRNLKEQTENAAFKQKSAERCDRG